MRLRSEDIIRTLYCKDLHRNVRETEAARGPILFGKGEDWIGISEERVFELYLRELDR